VLRTKVLPLSNNAAVNGSCKHVIATGQAQTLEINVEGEIGLGNISETSGK